MLAFAFSGGYSMESKVIYDSENEFDDDPPVWPHIPRTTVSLALCLTLCFLDEFWR